MQIRVSSKMKQLARLKKNHKKIYFCNINIEIF